MLGRASGWTDAIFPTYSLPQLSIVANIGLVFFMFFLGLELDPMLMKRQMKVAFPIAASAILVPFGSGIAASFWLYDVNGVDTAGKTAFVLFFGASAGWGSVRGVLLFKRPTQLSDVQLWAAAQCIAAAAHGHPASA